MPPRRSRPPQPNMEFMQQYLQLKIQLNRNPEILRRYPNIRVGQDFRPIELYETIARLVNEYDLNPTLNGVN